MSESRFYHISPEGKLVHVATLTEALAAARQKGFLWLDYYQPTKEELSTLIEPFGLHPLAIEDCTDVDQVPKIEDFPGNTFIIFNALSYADKKLAVDEVDLFISENFLITVSGGGYPETRRPLGGIERIVEHEIESVRKGPAFLMHVILDYVVDQKFVAIEALEDQLDAAEEVIMASLSSFNPAELLRLRRDLLVIRKSIFHEREILVKICRRDYPSIPEEAIFHYRDIYDHLAKFFELTETYRDIVTGLMEIYLSMLNNQLAKTANETNYSVRRMSLIMTIFMPLTLLAGIGGMSEWSMMTGPANWKISYPAFMLVMVVIGIANYYLLKRMEKKSQDQD
ncbi:MAG: magnesium transporter CorA family protein [Deltaproteobacteria bacterium]|nr:magnesium transporter CorA family protein [Deltaproteobacteria bacterium]